MTIFADSAQWLPLAFAILMGLSILVYVILDGYDLGIGILFAGASDQDKDRMIASIGPFWDANETWLVMAAGLLLVAFPLAHGVILSALYLPVALMLVGLILRGVAFEFRAKVKSAHKQYWNRAFFAGSLLTALTQGYMLGLYVMGLEQSPATMAFAALISVCVVGGYAFIGACWLIIKTEGALQQRALHLAKGAVIMLAIGFIAISIASPLVSARIYEKWFAMPQIILLAPLPLLAGLVFGALVYLLRRMPHDSQIPQWIPFVAGMGLFTLAFIGLAYSFYPYVVPNQLTLYEAASAPESLMILFVGAMIVFPVIAGYTAFSYWVFRGKARDLTYD
ncbi:cytochrome d ubiquinol oxidase subunit II [Telmatospirillum sp. J64-1]|uniref:cytochrome d ubiquinol oxidase subunit II n=1 Tax=Telmatospirillum sp. J64-1 TaxID=2502183 RepID=UPI00115F66CB|nr:cytochrome d ubiquinol oxidase subunit II [Telmatospirillum sp. J64-1]